MVLKELKEKRVLMMVIIIIDWNTLSLLVLLLIVFRLFQPAYDHNRRAFLIGWPI